MLGLYSHTPTLFPPSTKIYWKTALLLSRDEFGVHLQEISLAKSDLSSAYRWREMSALHVLFDI